MTDWEYQAYVKERIEGFREILRNSLAFGCACCGEQKPKGEAAGIKVYQTKNKDLQKAMMTPKGPRIGTYVTCLECQDKYSEKVIHTKVTKYLATQGLFG